MRMLRSILAKFVPAMILPATASAQIGLPSLPSFPSVELGSGLGSVTDLARLDALPIAEVARNLASVRIARLEEFTRRNRSMIELDANGNPAIRGILIVTGIDPAAVERAQAKGFRLIDRQEIEGLDLSYVRFAVSDGQGLKSARMKLARIAPGAEISADNIYFASGTGLALGAAVSLLPSTSVADPAIGMIDGGIGTHPSLGGEIEQRGFAEGAPLASAHATAIASLIVGHGLIRGAAPGAAILAADVYGSEPTGGSATAIARALGWMTARRVPIVTISLVGPDNVLLRAAVRAAQGNGVLIVVAVGNDGPAAPPSYPASLPGVLAVTGTDARERVLPEAGRAIHIDFAAPGSDLKGAAIGTGLIALRGTSFSAPLVAARLASHYPKARIGAIEPAVRALIAETKDLGKKGRDPIFGHGLVCGNCATR